MRKVLLSASAAAILFVSCANLDFLSRAGAFSGGKQGDPFTNAEAIQALKDALSEGASSACATLAAPNGYFGDALVKILLPPEAKPMVDNLAAIPGGQKLMDDVVLRLNRSAEKAVSGAAPIFVGAITDMTISDGIAIARGSDTAATEYLRSKTYGSLVALFKPEISKALNEPLVAGISADTAWQTLASTYNKAGVIPNRVAKLASKPEPMPEVTVDLAQFAAEKAIDAAFLKVAGEEKKIRANPMAYASAMIQKVFGALLK
jgi:hypothetical protein